MWYDADGVDAVVDHLNKISKHGYLDLSLVFVSFFASIEVDDSGILIRIRSFMGFGCKP